MRIRMRTRLAGPSGPVGPGQEVDLPDDQAQALIERGFAVAIEAPPPRTEAPPETTAIEPVTETTAKPPARKRKRA